MKLWGLLALMVFAGAFAYLVDYEDSATSLLGVSPPARSGSDREVVPLSPETLLVPGSDRAAARVTELVKQPSPADSIVADHSAASRPDVNDQNYKSVYADMTLEELELERGTVLWSLGEMTDPLFLQYNEAGRYEVIGKSGDKITLTKKDQSNSLIAIRTEGDSGEIRKIILSEDEFPEAYALKRRAEFAGTELRRRKIEGL